MLNNVCVLVQLINGIAKMSDVREFAHLQPQIIKMVLMQMIQHIQYVYAKQAIFMINSMIYVLYLAMEIFMLNSKQDLLLLMNVSVSLDMKTIPTQEIQEESVG